MPEGIHCHDLNNQKVEATLSVRKTNKFAESIFALLDNLNRSRPSATTLTNEACVVFSMNKTGKWLSEKTETERELILLQVRKDTKLMQLQFIERLEKISNEREEQARKKREYERKLAKSLKEKEDLANQMAFYGLWQNENDIDLSLAEIQTKTEKRKALVVQLKFRKNVLQQQFAESSVFNTSSTNKKALTLDDLLKNLKKLVSSL